jgi:hypothetical protein
MHAAGGTSREMKVASLILLLALCACRNESPPAPTSEQANQLNETEAMLNSLAQNEEGPEANASGPSN